MRSVNPSRMRLVSLAIAALMALFVLAGCGSDSDDSDGDNDNAQELNQAREERDRAQEALAEAQKANEAAYEAVKELEAALEGITDRTSMRQTELQMQLDAAKEELKRAQAVVKALETGSSLYKITVTNNLEEKLAPVVVTDASNDGLLFTNDNYVTPAAEYQILTGWPCRVLETIGEEDATSNQLTPTQPMCAEANKVTVAPGASSEIQFVTDALALRILAMVAPSMVPDHYVSAVADVPMEGPVTVPLSRFDIGHDEGAMDIELVAENAGTVTIERVVTGAMMEASIDIVPFDIVVTNGLSEKLAPVVVTRANDEHYLFDGTYVTDAAKYQILYGYPCRVLDAIGEGNAASNHPASMQQTCEGASEVTVAAGASSGPIMFDTDATAFRILAMVAPSMVPDHYVSAVVNVAALTTSGEYVTAPLSRFDIGDNEGTMDITRVDADMDIGMVRITRK